MPSPSFPLGVPDCQWLYQTQPIVQGTVFSKPYFELYSGRCGCYLWAMMAPLGSSAPVTPSNLRRLTFCLAVKGMKEQDGGGLWQTPTVALIQPLCKAPSMGEWGAGG